MADIRDENGRKERLFLFYDGESVSGKVNKLFFITVGPIPAHRGPNSRFLVEANTKAL